MLQICGNNRSENLHFEKVFANQIFDCLLEIAACFLKRARDESFDRRANFKDFHPSLNLSLKGDGSEIVLRGLQHPGTQIAFPGSGNSGQDS